MESWTTAIHRGGTFVGADGLCPRVEIMLGLDPIGMLPPSRVLLHVTLSLLVRSHFRHRDDQDDVQKRRWASLPASKDVRMQHAANLLARKALKADE
ncbi:MAG: hypothetical protein ACXVDI_20975, partial [Ktedonobacterales bacterium]